MTKEYPQNNTQMEIAIRRNKMATYRANQLQKKYDTLFRRLRAYLLSFFK